MRDFTPRVVVSLTSFPGRIAYVAQAVKSLLRQTIRPWKIILWLAKEEFPNGNCDLPRELLTLCNEVCFEIAWCENMRSYKKLIPAIREYPDDVIITVDDDIIFPRDSVERLITAYESNPLVIHALRVHQITHSANCIAPYADWIMETNLSGVRSDIFPTSGAGVLFPPGSLDSRVLDFACANRLCPQQDDVWYWAMALLKGTPISGVSADSSVLNIVEGSQAKSLWSSNCVDGGNDKAIRNIIREYPLIAERLSIAHPALIRSRSRCLGLIRQSRDSKRSCSVRLNVPLFSMSYNEDFTQVTYRVFNVPCYRRRCV